MSLCTGSREGRFLNACRPLGTGTPLSQEHRLAGQEGTRRTRPSAWLATSRSRRGRRSESSSLRPPWRRHRQQSSRRPELVFLSVLVESKRNEVLRNGYALQNTNKHTHTPTHKSNLPFCYNYNSIHTSALLPFCHTLLHFPDVEKSIGHSIVTSPTCKFVDAK